MGRRQKLAISTLAAGALGFVLWRKLHSGRKGRPSTELAKLAEIFIGQLREALDHPTEPESLGLFKLLSTTGQSGGVEKAQRLHDALIDLLRRNDAPDYDDVVALLAEYLLTEAHDRASQTNQ